MIGSKRKRRNKNATSGSMNGNGHGDNGAVSMVCFITKALEVVQNAGSFQMRGILDELKRIMSVLKTEIVFYSNNKAHVFLETPHFLHKYTASESRSAGLIRPDELKETDAFVVVYGNGNGHLVVRRCINTQSMFQQIESFLEEESNKRNIVCTTESIQDGAVIIPALVQGPTCTLKRPISLVKRTDYNKKVIAPRCKSEKHVLDSFPFTGETPLNDAFYTESGSILSQPSDDASGGISQSARSSSDSNASYDGAASLQRAPYHNQGQGNLNGYAWPQRPSTTDGMHGVGVTNNPHVFDRRAPPSVVTNGLCVGQDQPVLNRTLVNGHGVDQATRAYTNGLGGGNQKDQLTLAQRPARAPKYPAQQTVPDRLRSYARWPRLQPSPNVLSDAGFFYTGKGDLVRCFYCGIGLKDFSNSDDPLTEHVTHSGDCEFLVQLLGPYKLDIKKKRIEAQNAERIRQTQLQGFRGLASSSVPGGDSNFGVIDPFKPEYRTVEARLSTFAAWPAYLVQTPTQLAEAGLYYMGMEDHVRCFCCDGGLRRWDPEDNPWTEHCRWFPSCAFARRVKGDAFIEQIAKETEERTKRSQSGSSIVNGIDNLQLTMSDPDCINVLLVMGYPREEIKAAVNELKQQGTTRIEVDAVITAIEVIRERKQQETEALRTRNTSSDSQESLIEENHLLKSKMECLSCGNQVNALFLPCTHHRMCMTCAGPITECPVCKRPITNKIKTFMA